MTLVELEILRRSLLTCRECEKMVYSRQDVMGANHYPIPFWYTEDSQIMLIGIAPGRARFSRSVKGNDEYAFKMGSGKILEKAITEIGIDKKYFCITNVVKCTTPEDGIFLDDDVRTCCMRYLCREIELLNPLAIIVLGQRAKQLFDKFVNDSIDIYVDYLYHPAAVSHRTISYSTFYNRFLRILENI